MDNLPGKRVHHRIKALLFLVNLFVARTLGDCPKPVLAENIVLTNEALLMNEFPDNVEISLTCANGYVKDSGSGTITCTDGSWGGLDLTCKKKDCGVPLSQPYMTFDLSQGTLFGAAAMVICDTGYVVSGSTYKHCYHAGWTGKSTKCLIVTCDMPEEIANGRNSWESDDPPKYGENVQFFCNEGYTLTGKDSITCTEEGEYDFTAPQCLGVTNEDVFTTKLVTTPTSTTTPPTQETSATSTASATTTSSGHRDSTLTGSATPTVSLSARGTTVHLHGLKHGVKGWVMGSLHVSEGTWGWTSTVHLKTNMFAMVTLALFKGADIFTSEDNTTTTTLLPTVPHYSQGDRNYDVVDTKKDSGYTAVIISVVCVSIAVCIVALFIHKLLLKRKGSYDTGEDLKPELLQFQNL